MNDEREQRILRVVVSLSDGEVTTYGDVAADAGYPRLSRLVGQILARTDVDVPWWRVVNTDGRLVPGNEAEHASLLGKEGVTIRDGHVIDAPIGRFRRLA